jgi:hypothetical protein
VISPLASTLQGSPALILDTPRAKAISAGFRLSLQSAEGTAKEHFRDATREPAGNVKAARVSISGRRSGGQGDAP